MIQLADFPLQFEPARPWSAPYVGPLALGLVALVLAGLTLWTYRGTGVPKRRRLMVLTLRLAALAVAVLVLMRPYISLARSGDSDATLIISVDLSESMNNRDEYDGQSRWTYLQQVLREAEPALRRLREEQHLNVVFHRFGADVGDFDPAKPGKADGPRTDFAKMLEKLYQTYQTRGRLRGLLVLSDGADNGNDPPLPWGARFRNLPCPIHTFAFGKKTTGDNQRDILLTGLTTEPPEVPVKNELTVKATLDAPGLVGTRVRLRLYLDDAPEPVDTVDAELKQETGNSVRLKCLAPDRPGEVKVTVRVEVPREAMTDTGKEISTYVPVTKEGVSVLLVDRGDRYPEPQMLCDALRLDRRLRLTTAWFREGKGAAVPDFFQFEREHYDVVIIGDVTPGQMKARDPRCLEKIAELVTKQRTGLMVLGGDSTFGDADPNDSWANEREFLRLLPTGFAGGPRLADPVQVAPTADGWTRRLMRITPPENNEQGWRKKNEEAWEKMHELNGTTRLGKLQADAFVLATVKDQRGPLLPVIVGRDSAGGRSLAVALDTTNHWGTDQEHYDQYRRFWQQLVLWLAHQDEAQGDVWVQPERRRLAAGDKLAFQMALRDKKGDKVPGGEFTAKVITPSGRELTVDEQTKAEVGERGVFTRTEEPGEYRLVVTGKGQDAAGQPIPADPAKAAPTTVRFLVYKDNSETTRKAANPDLLASLAAAGGGKAHEAKDLAAFLQGLEKQTETRARPHGEGWPRWNREPKTPLSAGSPAFAEHVGALFSSGSLPAFLLFTALLGLEWYLRRRWGMV